MRTKLPWFTPARHPFAPVLQCFFASRGAAMAAVLSKCVTFCSNPRGQKPSRSGPQQFSGGNTYRRYLPARPSLLPLFSRLQRRLRPLFLAICHFYADRRVPLIKPAITDPCVGEARGAKVSSGEVAACVESSHCGLPSFTLADFTDAKTNFRGRFPNPASNASGSSSDGRAGRRVWRPWRSRCRRPSASSRCCNAGQGTNRKCCP